MTETPKICPECGYEFQGNGWDGIDGHWRAKHGHIMRYEEAWPLISSGEYRPKKKSREDANQAAFRIVKESTEKD